MIDIYEWLMVDYLKIENLFKILIMFFLNKIFKLFYRIYVYDFFI